MAAAADSYHGVTLVFASGMAFTGDFTVLGANEQSRDPVETTHHGTTTGRTFKPEALVNYGSFDFEFAFSAEDGIPTLTATPQTTTITYPIPPESSDATAATVAGTAFFTNVSYPGIEAGSTETAKISGTCHWDGLTAPAFTAQIA